MEVRVVAEQSPEQAQPFHLAVRIGDIQKQTRYDAKKLYKFPEARRFGKIDVFRHMGTCDIVWGADQPETRTVKVVSADGDTGMRLQVSMNRVETFASTKDDPGRQAAPETVGGSAAKPHKSKETSAQAKRYLQEHDVEGILTGAMRQLLKSMPEDAPNFLCNYIMKQYGKKAPQPPAEAPAQQAAPPEEAAAVAVAPAPPALPALQSEGPFREYYEAHFQSCGGDYFASLHARSASTRPAQLPGGSGASSAQQAQDASTPPRQWKLRPSVGTWIQKRRGGVQMPAQPAQPRSVAELTPSSAVEASSTEMNAKPSWNLNPSVGTWLQSAPATSTLKFGGSLVAANPGVLKPDRATETLRTTLRDVLLDATISGELQSTITDVIAPRGRDTGNIWNLTPSVGSWLQNKPAALRSPCVP